MKKIVSLILLSCLGYFQSLLSQPSNCWYQGEVIDSSSCDGNIMVYHHFPIDTLNGTYFTIYWGNGDSMVIQTNSYSNYPQLIPYTYNTPGVYFPYVVFHSPCIDTFSFWVYNNTQPTNQVLYLDSCRVISGFAFVDADNDCSFDWNEQIPHAQIKAYQNGQLVGIAYTNQNGSYQLYVGSGSYNLEFDNNYTSTLVSACGSSANPTNLSGNTYDFIFHCSSSTDLEVQISNVAYSPVFHSNIWFNAKNKGCNPINNAIIKIVLDSQLNYYSHCSWNIQNIVPTINGDTIIFVGINLQAYETFYGYLCVKGDTILTLGDTLCVTIHGQANNDGNLNNNFALDCSPVLTSYDPNMKEVTINGQLAEGYIPKNQTMTYTLHFQNTGNAPALHVVVKDTLTNNLDISTFQFLDASHPVQITINGQELIFNFFNIMLPDSASNPAGSQGFVKFNVAQKPNLASGTQIPNNCSIYFDYNPPIVTNTVLSIIEYPTAKSSSQKQYFTVYPNPTSNNLFIQTSLKEYEAYVYDYSGKLLMQQHNPQSLNLTNLPNGIYLLKLIHNAEYQTYKIIKE